MVMNCVGVSLLSVRLSSPLFLIPVVVVVVCAALFSVDESIEDQSKRKTSLLAYEGETDAEAIGYAVVRAKPLSYLPPAPADHERSPTLDEVR